MVGVLQFEPEPPVTAVEILDIEARLFDGDMNREPVKQISAEIQIGRSDNTIKVRRITHDQLLAEMPVVHRQNLIAFMVWLRTEAEARVIGG